MGVRCAAVPGRPASAVAEELSDEELNDIDEPEKQPENITDTPLPEPELEKVVGGTEAVNFNYGKIEWTYTKQKPD
jgi:hypothetical protein